MTARPPVLDAGRAVQAARDQSVLLAKDAAARDADRRLPGPEVDALSASGLLGITVPAAYGGPGLRASVAAEVFRLLATGDPNVAQIPQSHFVYVRALRDRATPEQQSFFFGEVLAGRRFGNAQAEPGTRHVRDLRTTLTPDGDGWRLDGVKGYSTGALFADWIPVLAHRGDGGPLAVAWVRRDAGGVEVVDDWNGLGQRTTASGTVRLSGVRVAAEHVTGYAETFDGPQVHGAFAQLLHAAIDTGIARAALGDAAEFVRAASRPYPDAGVDRHADDPLVAQAFGELEVAVRSAEALLHAAGRAVDAADRDLDTGSAREAGLAVAAVRVASSRAAVEAGSRLFELGGTRSALATLNLDRHWRNARTHTLHDPAAWKLQHLGRWIAGGAEPPNHPQF